MSVKKIKQENPQNNHPASIEQRIRENYHKLPESERKVADLILEFPGELAIYSATELASQAESSKAAVTRLIRRLGFTGFDQARRAARQAQNWGSPLYLMPRVQIPQQGQERIQHHIDQDFHNISKTFETLDTVFLDEIIKSIWQSRRVLILGYRNSHFLAGYLKWQIVQARDQVYLLPEAGESLAEYLAEITEEDLVIVIGFRRRVPEVMRTINAAIAASSKTLYITDPSAKFNNKVSWTIRCSIQGDDPFDRYSGAISLLHFLGVSLMNFAGEKGRKRLKSIEQLHETLHEFG